MADPYQLWIDSQKGNQQVNKVDPYDLYIQQQDKVDPYDLYMSQQYGYPSLTDEEKSRSVAMTGRELLEEQESPGFLGALWSGLKSGATLGYASDEPVSPESMTFGEEVAQLTGELAGGIIPFGVASVFTGGYGAPIAGFKYTKSVYDSISRLSKATRVMKKYSKSMDDIAKQAKTLGMEADDLLKGGAGLKGSALSEFQRSGKGLLSKRYVSLNNRFKTANKSRIASEEVITSAQRNYIEELVNKGAKSQAARLSKQISKTGTGYVLPGPRGKILGNSNLYKTKVIEPLAKKFGYKGAAIADRFANSALTFASVGLVSNKPGDSLIDRANDIPKDIFLGTMFAAAGVPTILGKWGKHAGKAESLGLLAIGSYQDHLTFNPDPNMDIKDRLLHGLGLVAFHHVGLGLSNVGIKDKMFNGLVDMGFDNTIAYEMAYNTKFSDDAISYSRKWYQRNGSLYVNKKNNKDVISISEFVSEKAAEDGEQMGYINYVNVGQDGSGTIAGNSLKASRNKLNKKYKKVDFNDKELIDDLPPEVRENRDAMLENLQSESIEIGGEKKFQLSGPSTQGEPTGKEIIERGRTVEQRAEKDFYRSQRKDLEKVSQKNRVFDAERDIEVISEEKPYLKGDLVEWVKDGKEMNVSGEGEFYPMKILKADSDYAYINIEKSTIPTKLSKQLQADGGRIPLSEIKMVRRIGKGREVSKYKLNLRYSNREDGKNHRKLKDTSWDEPLIFDSKEAAENYAMENWVGKWEANNTIKSKMKLFKAKESRVESTPEYKQLGRAKGMLNRAFKEKDFNDNEMKEVIRTIAPESRGDVNNMTIREIKRTTDLLKGDDSISFEVFDSRVRLEPDNLIDNINPKWGKTLKMVSNKFKETFLGTAAIGDMIGGWGAEQARRSKNHARFRNSFMGLDVQLHNRLRRDLRGTGISLKDINDHIHAILDPVTFEGHRSSAQFKLFEKKLQNFKLKDTLNNEINSLDAIVDRYRKFHDEAAVAQIVSNSYIRDTSTNTLKRVPFWKAYDTQGNKIELVDVYKNPELHERQVSSILKWMQTEGKRTGSPAFAGKPTIVNQFGNVVAIDAKKSKHFYVKDYSRRQVTEDFLDFINVPDGKALDKAATYMAKNDSKLRKLPFDEAYNNAKKLLKDIQKINSNNNIYGQQYTRIADLPAYMYVSRGKGGWGDILTIDKKNAYKSDGTPYKVGETIVDANNNPHTVGKAIKVYNTDYVQVINDYSSGLAHSTATYHAFGGKTGDINGTISRISEGLAVQTKDNYYRDWSRKIMESQVYGEKQSSFSKVMRPITRWSAIAGLSSPLSGLKNLMLGNVQNATVFTGRELWKAYLSRDAGLLNPTGGAFRKWRSAKEYAESTGATYQSSFDLHLDTNPMSGFMKRWLPNLGLMRTTEILNRTIAQSIGPYSTEIHIANMAGSKNPSTRGTSLSNSRRILRDVMEFTPEQVEQMVNRYKSKGKDFMLSDAERKQASQQAHVITQGSGDLPYLPYWMGRGWAKPLTLFYKVAYRITDTVAKNVIKPGVVDGNLVPAMKYMGLSALSGKALYSAYDFLFDEERSNKFKDVPSQWWDYFIKAEGLALFSNAGSQYGGFEEAYYPVPLRNVQVVWDNLWDFIQGKKYGSTALGDGVKEIVAIYGTAERILKKSVEENVKKHDDSKRRQYQFLDAYYPKDEIKLDYEDGLTAKTPHYRALRDVFWHDDPAKIAKTYYVSLAFLSHRIMEEKGIQYPLAEKEARQRLKKTLASLRPIPKSWMKTMGRTGKSRYMEYMDALSSEDRDKESNIMDIYRNKQVQFWDAIGSYRNTYYKKG